MREKYVTIRKNNLIACGVISLVVSLFMCFIIVGSVNLFNNVVVPIFADSDEENAIEKVEVYEETTKIIEREEVVEVEKSMYKMREVGSFGLTSYCPCSICCDQYAASPIGKTGSIGVGVYEGITFAVDPNVIPYGSKIYIEDVGVGIATDCGGAIKGRRIDVYIPDHQRAREFGTMGGVPKKVYILE